MISGMSISIRLTTGFGGFMPSHSLLPVTAPRDIGDISKVLSIINNVSAIIKYKICKIN